MNLAILNQQFQSSNLFHCIIFCLFVGDILGNFIQRITAQVNQFKHLLRTIFDVVSTQQIPTQGELTRDAFGLHTMIIVVTRSGKVSNQTQFK